MPGNRKEAICDRIDIYRILDQRARFVKSTNISLIILLIMAATLVSTLIVGYKDDQQNWISDILNTTKIKRTSLQPGDLVLFQNNKDVDSKHMAVFLGNDSKEGSFKPISREEYALYDSIRDISNKSMKSQSEKIANSIAKVLLTISLMIFVGFIMRAVLVFIRYYMQLGTDFENQRLAYIISKKEGVDFGKTLQDLRSSSISLEKTPQLPQEKVIIALVDALKKLTPSKG